MAKERLDVLITELGFYDSREKARRAVMAGLILVNGRMEDKPGLQVNPDVASPHWHLVLWDTISHRFIT